MIGTSNLGLGDTYADAVRTRGMSFSPNLVLAQAPQILGLSAYSGKAGDQIRLTTDTPGSVDGVDIMPADGSNSWKLTLNSNGPNMFSVPLPNTQEFPHGAGTYYLRAWRTTNYNLSPSPIAFTIIDPGTQIITGPSSVAYIPQGVVGNPKVGYTLANGSPIPVVQAAGTPQGPVVASVTGVPKTVLPTNTGGSLQQQQIASAGGSTGKPVTTTNVVQGGSSILKLIEDSLSGNTPPAHTNSPSNAPVSDTDSPGGVSNAPGGWYTGNVPSSQNAVVTANQNMGNNSQVPQSQSSLPSLDLSLTNPDGSVNWPIVGGAIAGAIALMFFL